MFDTKTFGFKRPRRGTLRAASMLPSAVALIIGSGAAASAHGATASAAHRATPAAASAPLAATPCVGGTAAGYPCNNVDLQSHLPLSSIGGGSGSGGWGWTDSTTGKEYALAARSNGTAFVDITNAANPVYLGNLPSATGTSSWRELNVYNNTAYIVSDSNGQHGLQVFDLTRLRGVTAPPVTFTADFRDTAFGAAHTVTVNYDTGYLFINGSDTCSGGPRIYNLANRLAPAFVGCVSGDGYTHDAQAVVYHGPDTRYTNKEILVASNESKVTVWDVTVKTSPVLLSSTSYTGYGYVHQGWFTTDQRYFLEDDETDEVNNGHNTYTYVFDMSSLTSPVFTGHFTGPTTATDHNQYVKGNYSYQSDYKAGLRIIDLTNVATPANMSEAAYFDTYPADNTNGYAGTWNNYPYYPSGNVAVFDIQSGLFVVHPNLGTPVETVTVTNPGTRNTTVNTAASLQISAVDSASKPLTYSATGLPAGLAISSSGLISGTPTATGTSSVVVTATSGTASGTTSFTWNVNPVATGGITNGGFETGTFAPWTTTGTATVVNSGTHSGTYAAQLGGTSPTNGDSTAAQTFTVPTGSNTLSFWYNVTCPDTVTYDWATATLKDNTSNTTTTVLAKTCVSSSGWTQVSSPVTAGHSYTLTLVSHDDNYAGDPTYTKYDDVALSSTTPPTNPIVNGGFETGTLSGWTTAGTASVTTTGPHSGVNAAQVGGTVATNGDSTIAQTFTATGGGTLSFWYNVTCPDTVTYDWATATLKDNTSNTTATVLAKTCVASSGWTQVSSPLTAGHSYTLTLTSHDDNYAGDPTYTKYDDVTVS